MEPTAFSRDDGISGLSITEGLVRISVGIEDETDLIHDFEQALDQL